MVSLRRIFAVSNEARLSARSAVCLTVPLVIGIVTRHTAIGATVSLGALWGISQDGMDRWRSRQRRIAGVASTASLGMLVGALVAHAQDSFAVVMVVLGLTAIVAGLVEASGYAAQGMYLILGAVVGTGLPAGRQPLLATIEIALGGFWVYAVAWLTDRRTRSQDERNCVAAAFVDIAAMFDAMGTSHYEAARATTITSLDLAQDVVGAADLVDKNAAFLALYQCFIVALQFGELTATLHVNEVEIKSNVAATLRRVATCVRNEGGEAAGALIVSERSRFATEGFRRVAHAFTLPDTTGLRGTPPFRRSLSRLSWPERSRFAVLLMVVALLATALAHAIDGPKSYWLPMTAIFVFRPDTGPVMQRALARTAGTLAGVAIAAAVALGGNQQWLLILLCWAMATAVPYAQRRNYALTVMCFTPIVFVFIGLMRPDAHLFGTRILDTVLGAGLVLALDFVFWVRAPSLRPVRQLDRAIAVTEDYLRVTASAGVVERHATRRKALRATSRSLEAFRQAERESRHPRDDVPDFEQRVSYLRRRIDEHAAELFDAGL